MNYTSSEIFRPRREYKQNERLRLRPDEIVVDELYIMMFALSRNSRGHRAAKHPAIIDNIQDFSKGWQKLSFRLPGMSIEDGKPFTEYFNDGYLCNSERLLKLADYTRPDDPRALTVERAYLLHPADEVDADWKALDDVYLNKSA